jgi:hypothetical protein
VLLTSRLTIAGPIVLIQGKHCVFSMSVGSSKKMQETLQTQTGRHSRKLIGIYLVEAGLVSSAQVEAALNEQKYSHKRLGEILVSRGWVAQQTIEYLMEKVILPERETASGKLTEQFTSESPKSIDIELASPIERPDSYSLPISAVPSRKFEISLSPRKIFRFLSLVILTLIILSTVARASKYFLPGYPLAITFARLFSVDAEQNIPTLYSVSALLLCSIILAAITYAKQIIRDRYVWYWRVLTIIFFFLSLDEAISIHEQLVIPVGTTVKSGSWLYFSWVIPGSIFVLICLVGFWQFLAAVPAKTRRLFLIAGALFVGGSIVTEMISGYFAALYGQQGNMIYALLTTLEEFFEMFGIAVFIYALLSYMSSFMKAVDWRVRIINDRKLRQRA